MLGALIIGLLIASIVILSVGFLLAALRLGKNFEQIGKQPRQEPPGRHHRGTRR